LALGDNFYDTGVKNANDPRFGQTFEKVYSDEAFQKKWYVVAGNHDHYGNVTGEVDYSKVSSRWIFPSLYYTIVVPVNDFTVQFVFIDTVVLAGLWDPDQPQPRGPSDTVGAQTEWQWINSTLQASKADWLFVVGHYPVYSTGEHGSTKILVQMLEPMLERYKVAAFIGGHDHGMQHLSPKTVNYFVIGNGAKCQYQNQHTAPGSKFRYPLPSDIDDTKCSTGGFGTITITKTTTNLKLFNDRSQVVYQYNFGNPKAA
jgi:tartrate-resistant acid phosphatase type 5